MMERRGLVATVFGAGDMGTGITAALINSGSFERVHLLDIDRSTAETSSAAYKTF